MSWLPRSSGARRVVGRQEDRKDRASTIAFINKLALVLAYDALPYEGNSLDRLERADLRLPY